MFFTLLYLKGKVYNCFAENFKDYTENINDISQIEDEINEMFYTKGVFDKKLDKLYGDYRKALNAERELIALKQKGLVVDYAAAFYGLAAKIDQDEVVLVATFYSRLKDDVKDEFARIDRLEEIQDLINKSINIDDRQYQRKIERKGQGNLIFHKKKQPSKPYYGP